MIGRRPHDDARAFDEALAGGAPRDEQIADLLRVAEDLCQDAAALQPATAFRESLRTQLMTEAVTVLTPLPPTERPTSRTAPPRPARRRVARLTVALVATAGAVGIVASSASAVPGEMLYPVKRTVENVELQLHRDDASRGAFQLEQASTRLSEARRLSTEGRSPDLIAETLEDFSSTATAGSVRLFSDYTDNGKEKSIRAVNDFAAASSVDLSALSRQLPEQAADAVTAAADAVTDLAAEAAALCTSCDPARLSPIAAPAKVRTQPATPAAPKATPRSPQKPSSPGPIAVPPAGATPAPTRPSATAATPTTPAAPAATTKPPSLNGLTDPLLGGLLGNEQQPGLVPGLLGGLLGNPPK
ncbi:DUF5667 domain-containing protein [Aeromicrobium wangtongii]|uniref:DUF5667 domain-containing protein n=1 Tax=Aeromicrobium wangtongii TaxID=2969247 RepID=A0ABY5M883_9ACTN|nr:DUF5667 domain-containing protein [Aeromicrobium wangtongii]MCD9200069.1 DUF5667 domain-containing protein [Aeromicrobium wangtongii]UUP13326.1 DUF5667 domain-containing protein [Aeromicrobium wangtongii]